MMKNDDKFVLFFINELITKLRNKESLLDSVLPIGDDIAELKLKEKIFPSAPFSPYFYPTNAILNYLRNFFEYFYQEYKILIDTNFPMVKKKLPSYMDSNFMLVGELIEMTCFGERDYTLRYTILKKDTGPNIIDISLKDTENSSIFLKNHQVRTRFGLLKGEWTALSWIHDYFQIPSRYDSDTPLTSYSYKMLEREFKEVSKYR